MPWPRPASHEGVADPLGAVALDPDLVAEVAGVAGARDPRPRRRRARPHDAEELEPLEIGVGHPLQDARDVGPCSASAPSRALVSSIVDVESRALPLANQGSDGSAAVTRKCSSPSRETVPSSTTLPSSSHQQR